MWLLESQCQDDESVACKQASVLEEIAWRDGCKGSLSATRFTYLSDSIVACVAFRAERLTGVDPEFCQLSWRLLGQPNVNFHSPSGAEPQSVRVGSPVHILCGEGIGWFLCFGDREKRMDGGGRTPKQVT